jgi:uncharacterized protein YrrD
MLRNINDLEGYTIHATDGTIGHVKDFYFDDEAWVIRYFIVDTGTWLSSRNVLISPIAINHPNWAEKILPVSITKEQVKNSPDIDTDKPVSRQHEILHLGYYGYSYYWGDNNYWGGGAYPFMMLPGYGGLVVPPQAASSEEMEAHARDEAARHKNDDLHLRSYKEVVGYHIEAEDGEIGHLQGILFEEETWAIRYLIVNTSNWWLGHKVLIMPQCIRSVNWSETKILVNLTQQAVKDAPPYSSTEQLNREQELAIFKHYGLTEYWTNKLKD